MNSIKIFFSPIFLLLSSCQPNIQDVFLGQGIMSGEVTSTTAILQSRLTLSDNLVNGDLKGIHGFGKFELSLDSQFDNATVTDLIEAIPENDYLIKMQLKGLLPGKKYFYRLKFGKNANNLFTSETGSFKTLFGAEKEGEVSLAVVTCMNYYFSHFGKYNKERAYSGKDKTLGYSALEVIK